MIELKHLKKEYKNGKNSFLALKGVDLLLEDKGLVVILGKSGSGKSTLLNLLGGLDIASEGEIIIDGKSFINFKNKDYDTYRNNYVGFVFQEFNLINELSINENIELGLKLKNIKDRSSKIDDVLSCVGLSNIGHKKCNELSGGQRQRVAIARALVKDPKFILADEPTGALDSSTSIDIFELFKNIAKDKLVVVVTHDEQLAYAYADRIVKISDGNIVEDITRNKEEKIRRIASNILEVDKDYKLTKKDLSSIAADNSYIGISTNLHDLTLAYDEISDYKREISEEFKETKIKISKDNEFDDTTTSLSYRDAYKLAMGNLKKNNKKYNFLKRICACFSMFLIISFIISALSVNSFVSRQTTSKNSLDILEVSHLVTKTKQSEIDTIKETLNNDNYGLVNDYTMTPYYGFDIENEPFVSEGFNGIVEIEDASKMKLNIIEGEDILQNNYQIIISDYMAHNFSKFGVFITYNDKLQIIYPSSFKDLINKKIRIEETDKDYEIVGIYKTNFYELLSEYNNGKDVSFLLENNIDFQYSKVYAKIDFYKQYKKDYKDYSFYEEGEVFLVNLLNNEETKEFYFNDTRLELNKDKIEENTKFYDLEGNESSIPSSLNDFEVILSIEHLYTMFYEENKSIEELLATPQIYNYLSNSNLKINLYQNNSYSSTTEEDVVIIKGINVKIVGILDNGNRLFVADNIYNNLEEHLEGYDSIYFYNEDSGTVLNKRINDLQNIDDSYIVGNNLVNINHNKVLSEVINGLSSTFIILTIIFLILSFIVCLNYMNIIVKDRNKELTLYRTLGAKKKDIYKIFVFESINISLKSMVIGIIGSYIITHILNKILSSISFIKLASITILSFNIIYCLMAFLVVFVICMLASYLSVRNLLNKKLVDAFKVN